MRRSRTILGGPARAALLMAVSLLVATLAPAAHAAAKKSSVSISKLTVGRTLAVSGRVINGADGAGAIQVADDVSGDDLDAAVPNGLDITRPASRPTSKKILTFHVDLGDAMPGLTIPPGSSSTGS